MKQYRIELTERALSDLEEIVTYISRALSAPDTALKVYDQIVEKIWSLEQFPARNAPVPFEPERSEGLRRINAGNYAVFYVVGEETVSITNVLYGGSNIESRIRVER